MHTLAFLYELNPKQFSLLDSFSSGDRVYIAHDAETIAASGSDTDPKRIPGTPYYALTRLSNIDKRRTLTKILQHLGHPYLTRKRLVAALPPAFVLPSN